MVEFGKRRLLNDLNTDDFAELRNQLAKKYGPVRLGNTIQYVRSVFKHAYDAGLIDRPTRFGPGFKRRGTLPMVALDLDAGWVDYPRPKTGIARRCPLWPETVLAIREALAKQPEAKNATHDGLVFRTKYGQSWFKDIPANPISAETRKLLVSLGINSHRNFYTLRPLRISSSYRSWFGAACTSRDVMSKKRCFGHTSRTVFGGEFTTAPKRAFHPNLENRFELLLHMGAFNDPERACNRFKGAHSVFAVFVSEPEF